MKSSLIIIAFALISFAALSQENRFTLSGGYAFANLEDFDVDATGFRINGLYEYSPTGGKVAHGLSIGYISTTASESGTRGNNEYKINSWPVYYAPKFTFGEGSFQGFIKGALGLQFANLTRTGTLGSLEDSDSGFYGGAGAGIMKSFGEKMFLNLEYEWAYMSNSYYKDGFMNTVMLGVGFKF